MSGLEHFDRELGDLDRQIARLGGLFGLDFTQDATVMRVLRGETRAESFSEDMRKTFMLMKGLLELRYHVEKQCVEDVGPTHCSEILQGTLLK